MKVTENTQGNTAKKQGTGAKRTGFASVVGVRSQNQTEHIAWPALRKTEKRLLLIITERRLKDDKTNSKP